MHRLAKWTLAFIPLIGSAYAQIASEETANPQNFANGRGPHLMPVRPPGYFGRAGAAPPGAHLNYYGGRVAADLQVVQVIWGSGSYLPQVTSTGTPSMASFYQTVLNSPYVDWLTEYDTPSAGGSNQTIGRGGFVARYTITPSTSATTIDDSTIQSELAAQIVAGHLPAPTFDAAGNDNTYYAVFFPFGKKITQGGSSSCVAWGFCAYHGTSANSQLREFYYGVHPDMQAGSGCDTGCGNAATPFGNYTSVASHEMIETITDAEDGLATVAGPPLAWYDATNGEIGDICNVQQDSITVGAQTYVVQQQWSNAYNACITTATPPFQLTPSALPFGSEFVYEASAAQVATVSNSSTAALSITGIIVAGANPGQFGKTTTCAASVPVGGSCTVTVRFRPTSNGVKNAILEVNTGGNWTKTVALSGTGVPAPFTLSSHALAFGSVAQGTDSAPQSVTVTNIFATTIGIALPITDGGPGANQYIFGSTCTAALAAGASCNFNVIFQPTTAGLKKATMNVKTSIGTQTVALSGTGT